MTDSASVSVCTGLSFMLTFVSHSILAINFSYLMTKIVPLYQINVVHQIILCLRIYSWILGTKSSSSVGLRT